MCPAHDTPGPEGPLSIIVSTLIRQLIRRSQASYPFSLLFLASLASLAPEWLRSLRPPVSRASAASPGCASWRNETSPSFQTSPSVSFIPPSTLVFILVVFSVLHVLVGEVSKLVCTGVTGRKASSAPCHPWVLHHIQQWLI